MAYQELLALLPGMTLSVPQGGKAGDLAIVRTLKESLSPALQAEARRLLQEDIDINRRIGVYGLPLVPPGSTILTHCNAGALATAGYGTALGVIRAAHFAGRHVQVFADETRPFLQGARLTTWELQRDSIPVTLITDNEVSRKDRAIGVLRKGSRIQTECDLRRAFMAYALIRVGARTWRMAGQTSLRRRREHH